jgi:DNA-binding PadR family transcriptional regulator
MATKIDLLLLGLLMDKPMHGYEVNQTIKKEGIDDWFNVSTAAIYYSLNKLRDQGLVAETKYQEAGAPTRSVFRLTKAGRAAFFEAMDENLGSQERTYFDFDLGILLLNKVPRDRALSLLEKRLEFLKEWAGSSQVALVAAQQRGASPLHLAILEHAASYARVEADWLTGIMQRISGEDEADAGFPAGRGLMLLSGDLRNFHFPDLIRLLASGRHTGTLSVTDGQALRTVTFQGGKPVCATSEWVSDAPHRDGQEDFVVPPSDVAVAQPRILNDIYDLFRWEEGDFSFDQGRCESAECIPLNLDIDNFILGGSRWVDNWDAIQRLVPSTETIFEFQTRPADSLELTAVERQVLASVDGIKDVAAIAARNDLTVFETSKVLYCLTAVGLLRSGDQEKIRLRRFFREFAELMCRSTQPWRDPPDNRGCEIQVNQHCAHLPIRFDMGRIQDETDPALKTEELADLYRTFLSTQYAVIKEWFGEERVRRAFDRVLRQLSPGLQEVFGKYHFEGVVGSNKK